MTEQSNVGFPAMLDSSSYSEPMVPSGFIPGQSVSIVPWYLPAPFIHVRLDKISRPNNASGKGITVAVLDSGCASPQAGIDGRQLPCHEFFDTSNPVVTDGDDEWGHGTKMAGIIAAANGYLGVAVGASILPIKVVRKGTAHVDFAAVAAALEWLAEANNEFSQMVSVVNLSISTWTNDRDPASANKPEWLRIAKAIKTLRQNNVVVVAATGNAFANHSNEEGMGFPALVPGVISVAAVHSKAEASRTFIFNNMPAPITNPQKDHIAPFSQRLLRAGQGDCYTRLMAPGVDIDTVIVKPLETDANDVKKWKLRGRYSGTSAAAALVSGVVALMQDVHLSVFHKLPAAEQIEEWLTSSGQQVKTQSGANFVRLDAFAAMGKAKSPPTS